jgi:hypothetical protein
MNHHIRRVVDYLERSDYFIATLSFPSVTDGRLLRVVASTFKVTRTPNSDKYNFFGTLGVQRLTNRRPKINKIAVIVSNANQIVRLRIVELMKINLKSFYGHRFNPTYYSIEFYPTYWDYCVYLNSLGADREDENRRTVL